MRASLRPNPLAEPASPAPSDTPPPSPTVLPKSAASCPAMENSGRRNISFDPMPGQGVELLAGFKGSALELLQAALAACLTVRRRAAPSESPLNNGILAIIPRGLYTALKKQQKYRGICRLPRQGKPAPEETKGGENDADLIFFPYKQ